MTETTKEILLGTTLKTLFGIPVHESEAIPENEIWLINKRTNISPKTVAENYEQLYEVYITRVKI